MDSWTNQIIDQCLKALQAQEKPFKYAGASSTTTWPVSLLSAQREKRGSGRRVVCFVRTVSVILQQKVGAGLHMAAGAHWDTKRDGLCELTLDNGHIECVCTVYGVALSPSPQEA